MAAAVNALPPELFHNLLVDNSDEKIVKTYKDKTNRIIFEKWFSTLDDTVTWINDNKTLGLRVLKVISQECEQEEFLAVQKIYDVFRESLLFKVNDTSNLGLIANEFLHKFFRSDPQGFEQYLTNTSETGSTPLHIAFYTGDIAFTSFVELHLPDLFDHLLEWNNYSLLNPLLVALHSKKLNVLKFVQKKRPQVFLKFLETKYGKWERTPLLEAASTGNLDFFTFVQHKYSELFLRYSRDVSKNGFTCLHWAVFNKQNHICDFLQSSDPEIFNQLVKCKDSSDLTPMHYAILSLNSVFIKKIKFLIPSFYHAFFKSSDPEIFQKLLCGTPEKPRPLLTLMIKDNESELFELILNKEPNLCEEILLKKEFSDYPDPLKIAFENERIPILDLLYLRIPALFDKLKDYSFVLSIVDELDENSIILLHYCTHLPVTTAFLHTLFNLEANKYRITVDHIINNLALPHGRSFLEAIIQSEKVTDFLSLQEDILTKYLDELPNLDFLSWESGMDILVQLPPREIKSTMENIEIDTLDSILDSTMFIQGDLDLDGSYQSSWWVLQTIYERYENNLDDDNFLSTAKEELALLTPQCLAACCVSAVTESMVKKLLKAIPEPHYRVVIPILSIDEYRTFMHTLSMDQQLHYIRVSTGEQKLDYLNTLVLKSLDSIELWATVIDILIDEIQSKLNRPNKYKEELLKNFNKLKKLWFDGQSYITLLSKQEVILVQLIHHLKYHENTPNLTSLINNKLNPYIQKVKAIHLNIKCLRSVIWDTLAKHPLLIEDTIPEDFICPISGEIMQNPVKDPYGHSYDKEMIIIWIKENGTSPITRKPLTIEDLVSNTELLDRIKKYQNK